MASWELALDRNWQQKPSCNGRRAPDVSRRVHTVCHAVENKEWNIPQPEETGYTIYWIRMSRTTGRTREGVGKSFPAELRITQERIPVTRFFQHHVQNILLGKADFPLPYLSNDLPTLATNGTRIMASRTTRAKLSTDHVASTSLWLITLPYPAHVGYLP